jgi:cardiolipin synthase
MQTGFAQNWLKTTGELVSGPAFFPEPQPAGRISVLNLLSSPQAGTSSARLVHELALRSAHVSILLANPYFIPDHETIRAFVDARLRGVDVKLLVSGDRTDQWLARLNSVRLYGPLLEAGVEIYEYQRTMLHQKFLIVDEAWSIVGTTNFDTRSFALNEEHNVCFDDPRLTNALRESFDQDLAHAKQVQLHTWRRRGLLLRCQELLASVLQDQM